MYWFLVWVLAFINLFFDAYYFLWNLFCLAKCDCLIRLCGGYMDLYGTLKTWGICWSTDLDYFGHMNNARYLRNADVNRLEFVMRTGMLKVIRRRKVDWFCTERPLVHLLHHTARGAQWCPLMRDIEDAPEERLFYYDTLLCWDEKAFYFEQRYERIKDGFICAITVLKAVVIGVTPGQIVEEVLGKKTQSPEFPDELKAWIECNNISSQKLRKEL